MWAWLRTRWEGVATSLWFVPMILLALGVVVAVFALNADVALEGKRPWWLYSGGAEGAVTLLSSLLGALITMATLAVSITMVVLTLAANQLGPRLIRSFMADKRTQAALGFFLGTIVYLVLILRTLHSGLREEQTPHVAITIGTLFTIMCVIVLLFFVHHLGRSIVSDNVIQKIGAALDQAAETLLPDRDYPKAPAIQRDESTSPFCLSRSGYVQAVDYGAIAEFARRGDATVILAFRPGLYVIDRLEHARVAPSAALTKKMKRDITECVTLGPERTAHQDIEYPLRQLVEIALRALSPSINDPYTALAVIDHLAAFLARAMDRGQPTGAWCDCEGVPRVFGPVSDFEGLVEAAFNQVRQFGAGNAAVLIRLTERLSQLQACARTERQRVSIERHAQLVENAARHSLHDKSDLEACLRRGRQASPPSGA